MKRFVMTFFLLTATLALPGCMFAVGSKIETDQSGRIDKLERRISTAEKQLGITPPPPAELPPVDHSQVNE